ncbi:unnamed protein product [Moneuplotes crassus]|uniref:Uncharacterized protein n=1 Tax=Euplotes crassus TaxID=5936 RepID=A0AAD2CVI4_EUPCR|nr:unnamed protein product [Moneuplotes crassus]
MGASLDAEVYFVDAINVNWPATTHINKIPRHIKFVPLYSSKCNNPGMKIIMNMFCKRTPSPKYKGEISVCTLLRLIVLRITNSHPYRMAEVTNKQ